MRIKQSASALNKQTS